MQERKSAPLPGAKPSPNPVPDTGAEPCVETLPEPVASDLTIEDDSEGGDPYNATGRFCRFPTRRD